MQYERTTLRIAKYDDQCVVADAVRVGDWYAHLPLTEEKGVNIAHRSGIGLRPVLPGTAVTLLRELQTYPPCPLSDDDARLFVAGKKSSAKMRNWVKGLRDLFYRKVK